MMNDKLPAETRMGRVALTVHDLERSLDYYAGRLGLRLLQKSAEQVILGAGQTPLLVLQRQPGARPARGVTGLYHFALLLPSRLELARTLRHLLDTNTPLAGASDHAVSEALYLTDPDGHGIEIYRDRPRTQWEYPGGALKLTVDPFDAAGVLAVMDATTPAWEGLHPDTVMGHVHLHVSHLPQAQAFYVDQLGFDLMARYGHQAAFVAAGGYHHHLGLNTWAGVGAPPPPANAARLLWYEMVMGGPADLQRLVARLTTAGHAVTPFEEGYHVHDPASNGILLTAR